MAGVEGTDLVTLRGRLASLDAAMASGVLTVEDADTGRITYRSYREMRQARADLIARINEFDARPRNRSTRPFYDKGW